MRDRTKAKEHMRKRRYSNYYKKMKSGGLQCFYCNSIAETLHHVNEDQSDNRVRNLLPVCRTHHLEMPHECDINIHRPPNKPKTAPLCGNSPKLAPRYPDSTVTRRINDVTLRNPKSCTRIYIDSLSLRAYNIVLEAGYTEQI